MRRTAGVLCVLCVVSLFAEPASAQVRVQPPQFEQPHDLPATLTPAPRAAWREYADVGALAALLAAATYFALRRRSRAGVVVTSLAALAYLGFWRQGCVCPVGSIQNVCQGLGGGYAIPLSVLAFFLLPLAATLLFGRTFCAGACPLGAIQDVVLLRPLKVPAWLDHALGLLPYVYLALAAALAYVGSAYVICRYDPFVGFFRLSATAGMLTVGGCLLFIALFVGRPYCRYLCPYGAILRPISWSSWRHAKVSPDRCVQCRLCEQSCPFGALRSATPETLGPRRAGLGLLAATLALTPLLAAGGAALGWMLRGPLSYNDATVRLAQRVQLEEAGLARDTTDASLTFRQSGQPRPDLYAEARRLTRRVGQAGAAAGGFVGLVVGLKLVSLTVRRRRKDFEPDRAKCFSCGRCFKYCPVGRGPAPAAGNGE